MKVEEKQFDLEYINKYASQMTIGNGFFGIRGSQEEDYRNQVRECLQLVYITDL
ncbi:hypothetical protein LOS19_13545 [Enterococcus faecium]|nr:hypothetical protein [Enterococcus faecium]